MRNLAKPAFLFFLILSLGARISSQELPVEFGKPTVKISISPQEPSTEDMVTFKVEAQDNSGTGLKRIVMLVNEREVNVCLRSPCVFFGGPYPAGPLKYEVKVYDHTINEPASDYRIVNVVKASRQRGLPGKAIDLMPLAEDAKTRWANGFVELDFPGEEGDLRGFVCYRHDSLLEDDKVYPKALLTHPNRQDEHGLIVGIFKIENLPEKATFKTDIGFLKEADQTEGAEFKVFVNKDPSFYTEKRCYFDGRLDNLSLDLGRYAGQDIELVLQVRVLYMGEQAWAVWVNPRIEW